MSSYLRDTTSQTNILALNAAVEKAQGLCFRGWLCGRGGGSAQFSPALLPGSTGNNGKIREELNNAIVDIELTQRLEAWMAEIVDRSKEVCHLVTGVSTSCQEQSIGVSEVNSAVCEIDRATQVNAASAQESAAAESDVKQLAQTLIAAVLELQGLVYGAPPVAQMALRASE